MHSLAESKTSSSTCPSSLNLRGSCSPGTGLPPFQHCSQLQGVLEAACQRTTRASSHSRHTSPHTSPFRMGWQLTFPPLEESNFDPAHVPKTQPHLPAHFPFQGGLHFSTLLLHSSHIPCGGLKAFPPLRLVGFQQCWKQHGNHCHSLPLLRIR